MSEEYDPNNEELKAQERVEIPVDDVEDETGKERAGEPEPDVADALRDLGRQFAETLRTVWNSQERKEFETEVREGVRRFGDEINEALREAKKRPAAQKMKEEAEDVRTRVETGQVSHKARATIVDGLHRLSQELDRLADQFSTVEYAESEEEESQSAESREQ